VTAPDPGRQPATEWSANGTPEGTPDEQVAEIRRMLIDDAQDTRDGKDTVRDPVPGTGERHAAPLLRRT
jgi:hypothetical protein